jgi:hypothetical protein
MTRMNRKISITIAVIALLALSSLSIAATNALVNPTSVATSGISQRSYIRVNGIITQWGTTNVNGTLQTQAGTSLFNDLHANQLASATAIWTTNLTRPISAVMSKENFTYTYYVARLTNASVSTLATSTAVPNNYFLNGTWNVFTVTSTVTIITNIDGKITHIHRSSDTSIQKAYGELNVTDNWTKFTLSINGIDPLTGSVFRSVIRQVQFNPFKVTDDTSTNAINKADIAAVIRIYGAMPGWGNYDARMDYCNHYKIDIADLSTVASKL